MDIWPVVHDERRALAADLRPLEDSQWSARSLCSDWTVRDVVAHMTAAAKRSPAAYFPRLLASGLSLRRLEARDIAIERGSSPADTLARFEAAVTSKGRPPGPVMTVLGEVIIHSQDIRQPLGIQHDYPKGAIVEVADFVKRSNLRIGTRRRIAGLSLRATDVNWSHGSGPEVAGPILALVMAMTGRKAAISQLSGEGVEALRARD